LRHAYSLSYSDAQYKLKYFCLRNGLYSILRLRLSLYGEASSPRDNLSARICGQILAGQMNIFNVKMLQHREKQ
jgi:hypothetical protein